MGSQNRRIGIVVGAFMGVLCSAAFVLAGSLEPSVGPKAADSQMYTLDQIYDRLNAGTAAIKNPKFTEPGRGPTASTMHTLDEIYDLVGQRAPVPKTGQTTSYATSDDGALQKGVAWPSPRFTDNNNGTVTDNLTGLIWLKDANCTDTVSGINKDIGTVTWTYALTWSSNLAGGSCGLTDGSKAGDWRLPNVRELHSLIDFAYNIPALSNAAGTGQWKEGDPFTGVVSGAYWSSTTSTGTTDCAYYVILFNGYVADGSKEDPLYIWPVRGGQ